MSNDNRKYITRDFYDSNMREFKEAVNASIAAAEARCERIAADMRADNARVLAEFKAQSAELRAQYAITQEKFTSVDKRLDNIEKSQDKFFRNTGLALTGMTLLFTALQISLSLITIMK
ncbi:MAG: hypothetical protein IJS99_03820 [Synergistaceae bacterium]|nr:hypothetical protein [Synergistaceae bacterium]